MKTLLNRKQNKLINIAWQEVEGFIKEWTKSPYKWSSERDVQAEIVGRIKKRYERIGQNTIWAKYTDKRYGKRFLKDGITMGRVVCEPPVYYRPRRGRYEVYRPDIVVFDDIKHPECPKEDQYQTKSNDDILWVCEIKYNPPWKPTYHPANLRDIDKLKKLLKQKDGTRFACCLHIAYKGDDAVRGKHVSKLPVMGKLRVYNVTLSEKQNS